MQQSFTEVMNAKHKLAKMAEIANKTEDHGERPLFPPSSTRQTRDGYSRALTLWVLECLPLRSGVFTFRAVGI